MTPALTALIEDARRRARAEIAALEAAVSKLKAFSWEPASNGAGAVGATEERVSPHRKGNRT